MRGAPKKGRDQHRPDRRGADAGHAAGCDAAGIAGGDVHAGGCRIGGDARRFRGSRRLSRAAARSRMSSPASLRQTAPGGRSTRRRQPGPLAPTRVRERIRIHGALGRAEEIQADLGLIKVHSRMSTICATPRRNPPPAPPVAAACWLRLAPSAHRAASRPRRVPAFPARPRSAGPRHSGNSGSISARKPVAACRSRARHRRRLFSRTDRRGTCPARSTMRYSGRSRSRRPSTALEWSWPCGRRAACRSSRKHAIRLVARDRR